jgi:hypothetical protein
VQAATICCGNRKGALTGLKGHHPFILLVCAKSRGADAGAQLAVRVDSREHMTK